MVNPYTEQEEFGIANRLQNKTLNTLISVVEKVFIVFSALFIKQLGYQDITTH